MGFEEKTGHLWQCIGERPDVLQGSGLIYQFKRLECDDDALEALWPALEPVTLGHYSDIINSLSDDFESLDVNEQCLQLYAFLGYGCIRDIAGSAAEILELPDHKTLVFRWCMLQRTYADLKALDIIESEGVAGDMDFVDAYINHDALLSSGREFVHDHFYHIRVLIRNMWLLRTEKDYMRIKQPHLSQVKNAYMLVRSCEESIKGQKAMPAVGGTVISAQDVALLTKSLGLVVDALSAADVSQLNSLSYCCCMSVYLISLFEDVSLAKQYFDRFGKDNWIQVRSYWSRIQQPITEAN